MPDGVTGQKLARTLQANRPDLKVIFSSGYECEDLDDCENLLDSHSNFLKKPYRLDSLARMVRESLETEKAA
jgi:DNA-binding NtrC family response regulator